jgi:hypothetical protein
MPAYFSPATSHVKSQAWIFPSTAAGRCCRSDHGTDTVLEHTGRDPASNYGVVNPPVYHDV